jgi:NAD(P)-dependent dehydrogenase (short-subunit alcohol dehydrogenase family)
VAIVTGGAGNVGAHISRLFAAHGAGVVVNDVNAGSGARVVGEMEAAGGRAVFDSTDVPTFAGGRALVARAVDEFGTVDALALLAGRIPLSPLADISGSGRLGLYRPMVPERLIEQPGRLRRG